MSYTAINGMRSNRYPLALAGDCGCGGRVAGPVVAPLSGASSLGVDIESVAFGGAIVAAGGIGLLLGGVAGYFLGQWTAPTRRY